MGAAVGEAIGASDSPLLGRRGYEEFAAYWPHQDPADNDFASVMNDTPKYVASTTLTEVEWQNSTLLEGDLADAVNELKAQPGKNIGMSGSATLVRCCRAGPPRRAAAARAPARRRSGREAVPRRLAARVARAVASHALDRRPRPDLPSGGPRERPPTVRSRDGTPIAYDTAGDGPAVILVGGAFSYRHYRLGAAHGAARAAIDRDRL